MLKKTALCASFILLISPVFALAQTASLSSQVAALLAQIAQLQTQTSQSQGQPNSASACLSLSHNLYLGTTDAATNGQVTELQQFLHISPATGYFGSLTQKAVQSWQSSHGIVASGSPSTTGFGSVGARTRAAMQCLSSTSATTPTSVSTSANTNAQMQMYTNAQYGFSFEYPADFSVTDASLTNRGKVTAIGPELYGTAFPAPSVLVEASADSYSVSTCNTQDLGSLLSIATQGLNALGISLTPTTGTQTIGGVSFRSASVAYDLRGSFASVGFYAAVHNGVCYVIGTTMTGNDPSTLAQTQVSSTIGLPASAARIVTEENSILQSITFSPPTGASVQSNPALLQATASLQDASRKSDLASIQVLLELSYNQYGKYPSALTAMSAIVPSVETFYDPATFVPYTYQSDVAGDSYSLCATLSSGAPYCVQSPAGNVATGNPSVTFIATNSNSNQQIAIGSVYQIQWHTSGAIPPGAFMQFSLLSSDGKTYGIAQSSDPTPMEGSYVWSVNGPVCVPNPSYPGTLTCSAPLNPGQYQILIQMYSTVVNGQPSGLITQATSPWITLTGSASNNVDPLKG